MSRTPLLAGAVALATVALPATALAGPYDKGPAPTAANLVSASGPYTVGQTTIANADTPGFGAATVWAPTNAAAGETFGGIAVAPGWTEGESVIKWLGPQLASKGFVVITINVNNTFTDFPASRGDQLNAALAYLTGSSPAKALVDKSRLGVIGHSMGGGGVLEAARKNPTIKATVGLTPWNQTKSWGDLTAPSLVIGAENDIIATRKDHALPFYTSFAASLPKAYLIIKGGDHFVTNSKSDTVAAATTSWVKRYVDGDTRYTSALTPSVLGAVSSKVLSYQNANVR